MDGPPPHPHRLRSHCHRPPWLSPHLSRSNALAITATAAALWSSIAVVLSQQPSPQTLNSTLLCPAAAAAAASSSNGTLLRPAAAAAAIPSDDDTPYLSLRQVDPLGLELLKVLLLQAFDHLIDLLNRVIKHQRRSRHGSIKPTPRLPFKRGTTLITTAAAPLARSSPSCATYRSASRVSVSAKSMLMGSWGFCST